MIRFMLCNNEMNSGGIGTTPKIEQAEAERVLAQSFQFQQQNIQDVQRNPPHHSLAGVSVFLD